MANEYTPNQATAWIDQVWVPEIGIAAYEEMRLAPLFKRLPASHNTIHYRKHANLARQSASGATVLLNLTYSGATEVEVTKSPQTSYIAVAVNLNTIARMMMDPTDTFRKSIEMSIAEGVDVECAKLADDLTQIQGGAGQNVTEVTFLDALVSMAEQAKSYWKPGVTRGAFAFHVRQIDDVIASTQNWSQWQITGRTDGPVSTGWIKATYGCDFIETGNIQNIGSLFHNPLFIPDMTFGIGYNQEPTVRYEERDLAKLIMGWTDFAAVTLWDNYGADYQTQTVA